MSDTQLATKKTPVLADSRGLKLTGLDEMARFCQWVVASRQFKDIETPEIALIRMQAGLELGLSPIWSLTNIMVVNGRPSVWGDALLGLVQGHKECDDVIETFSGENESMAATCEVRRRGHVPTVRTFSVEDAKLAKLWGKPGPWVQFPKRMLQMRARAFACRDAFADALRGIGVVEELRDIQSERTIQAREIPAPVLPDEIPHQATEGKFEQEKCRTEDTYRGLAKAELSVDVQPEPEAAVEIANGTTVESEARESTESEKPCKNDHRSLERGAGSDSRGGQESEEKRNEKGEFEF
jgi:hypothetical protein